MDNAEPTRRRLLVAATTGTALLAGCLSGDGNGGDDTDDGTNGTGDDPADGDDPDSTEDDTDNNTGGAADETTAATVPVRGDPDAAVTLEVYEDLTCPACAAYFENGFPTIETAYLESDRIRYEHRDFPVLGQRAEQAASAAREVLDRGGTGPFWEYKSTLLANQDQIESEAPDLFGDLAATLGLDTAAVTTAGADRVHQSVVDDDIARGQELGVSATPSFVVNGELVDTSGARSVGDIVDAVSETLDAALDEAGSDY